MPHIRSRPRHRRLDEGAAPSAKGSRRAAWLTTRLLIAGALTGALTIPANAAAAVEIVNSRTSLRADVMWASQDPFQRVFLWPNNYSGSQEFVLLHSGDGQHFRIRARHSGQCLMPDWRQWRGNGTPIIQYPYCESGYAPAEWRTESRAGNALTTSFVLRNKWSGLCLDADNGRGSRPPQGAVLQLWQCIGSSTDWNRDNQQWTFLSSSSGY